MELQFDPIRSDGAGKAAAERALDSLETRRAEYARRIVEQARIDAETVIGSRIAAAFAAIPREKFLGPPPWRILSPSTHILKVSENPADLYDDVLVSLGAGGGLNNGQPSLHAACLRALMVGEGEHAVHVGAGTGYYTAILAMLAAPGRVDAYEIEPELAAQAAFHLARFPHVEVHARTGAAPPLPACDVLYVNAGAPEPLAVWLDALKPNGRLLFPMAPGEGPGQMLLVTRKPEGSYAARFLGGVEFVPCTGIQDPEAGRRLARAFRRGRWKEVKSLRRNQPPDASCWLAGRDWWLSTQE